MVPPTPVLTASPTSFPTRTLLHTEQHSLTHRADSRTALTHGTHERTSCSPLTPTHYRTPRPILTAPHPECCCPGEGDIQKILMLHDLRGRPRWVHVQKANVTSPRVCDDMRHVVAETDVDNMPAILAHSYRTLNHDHLLRVQPVLAGQTAPASMVPMGQEAVE